MPNGEDWYPATRPKQRIMYQNVEVTTPGTIGKFEFRAVFLIKNKESANGPRSI